MTRILMISDIHGCLDPFNELLEFVNYQSSNDQLIVLGDYVDRGPKSRETVDRVIDLVKNHHVIALRGNHDQRLVDLIRTDNPIVKSKFLEHGGLQTLQSYCDFINSSMDESQFQEAIDFIRSHFITHIDFLESLPLYHEDKEHIYVHAGLNPKYNNWKSSQRMISCILSRNSTAGSLLLTRQLSLDIPERLNFRNPQTSGLIKIRLG
ncbi:metallophosphoesterase family protein [Paenibacillus antarcticus]|uniref:metallophosphoesterase family protein n=1 Tax=Paenibacillus antarcticus TaxID=253703 RepID=UPI000A8B87C2|nr:metallophosphoesterase family protein [Paenibacillus antarcticus]